MRTNLPQYFYCLALLLFALKLQASHIVGGEVSYECLSYDSETNSNNYLITLIIYRNCGPDAMDDFDFNAPITIYEDGDTSDFFQHHQIPLIQPVLAIPSNIDNPCLIIPPNLCIQEGIYEFEVNLPVSSKSYFISYQRCCRNAAITNIVDPNMTGATYMVEILPAAQLVCNSSPTFKEYPPLIVCVNEDINFDHAAVDAENDQLVYEFCAPLRGAGVLGAFEPGDPTSCDGFQPNPACPPPYFPLAFVLPTYTALSPMAGNPTITIDPLTGKISGVPELLGKFVVGICVSEYRNGELLGVIRRDFQFNVAYCEPTVHAAIEGGEIIEENTYVYNFCSSDDITLENASIQEIFIEDYFWEFDFNGQIQTYNTQNITIADLPFGTYEGLMVVNPGTVCDDTANIVLNLYPELNADFSFNYDTCVAGPVSFTDLSVAESGTITEWLWDFGDGQLSTQPNPDYRFETPGWHEITLTVTDINNCVATQSYDISWQPAPEIIVVEPSSFLGCVPLTVQFNNLSNPIDESYTIVWNFGDGQTSNLISPGYQYQTVGFYDVSLSITSPIGCSISTSWENWISVQDKPIAAFSFTPEVLNAVEATANFTDESIDAVAWEWTFDERDQSLLENPMYTFQDTGLHVIQLVVTHPEGCTDTTFQRLDIMPFVSYYLPNAFTPNADAVNDGYRGVGILDGVAQFSMTIWNRWGENIFETNDPSESWNGRKNNIGAPSPNGLYICLVRFTGPRGKICEYKQYGLLAR